MNNYLVCKRCWVYLILLFSIAALFSDDNEDFTASFSFYRDGFYDNAERSFSDFVEKYPGSVYIDRALYYLALTNIKQNKLKDSITPLLILNERKDFKYKNDVVYYLALNYYEIGEYKKAIPFIETALSSEIARKEKLLFIKIKIAVSTGDFTTAKNTLDEYLENKSFEKYRIDILKCVIDFYIVNEDYPNAIILMDLLVAEMKITSADKILIHYNYLYSLYMSDRQKEALAYFERNTPDFNKELYFLVSNIYHENNDKNKCFEILETIYKNTKDLSAVEKQALILSEQGKYRECFELLLERSGKNDFILLKSEVASKIPDNKKGLELLKTINIKQMNKNELLLFSDFVLKLNDRDGYDAIADNTNVFDKLKSSDRNTILYNTAVFFYENKEYKKAIKSMERWLSEFYEDSYYDKVLYMNGVSYKNTGLNERAVIEFSKLQKYNKKDQIYYESYVDKGECFFSLREYGKAIESYEAYLNNKVTADRVKDVTLQLGNSYFNIKKFDRAFSIYEKFYKKYGNSGSIVNKISETLLKKGDYKQACATLEKFQNEGVYPYFVYLYSCYKIERYEDVLNAAEVVKKYKNTKDYKEILYLIVLSAQKIGRDQYLVDIYMENEDFLHHEDDGKIRKILFKSFLKMRKPELAAKLFENPDEKTLYYIGDAYADALFATQADSCFIKLLDSNSILEYRPLVKIYKFYINFGYYDKAVKTAELINTNFPTAAEPSVYLFYALYKQNDIAGLKKLSGLSKDILLKKTIDTIILSANKKNTTGLTDDLTGFLDNADLDKIMVKYLFRVIIESYIKDNEYKKAAFILNKIPSSKLNSFDADIRFMEGVIYENADKKDKAMDLYLKIFYIYPSDIFWVHKSVLSVIRLYNERSDVEKAEKIREIFENKYFKL